MHLILGYGPGMRASPVFAAGDSQPAMPGEFVPTTWTLVTTDPSAVRPIFDSMSGTCIPNWFYVTDGAQAELWITGLVSSPESGSQPLKP